jgi:RNA polymerase sigma factor (sigma-70 family)
MTDPDAALLAAIREGSEHAFTQLVDRHQQGVRRFLRNLTSPTDADDVAQETFLAAWTQSHTFRGGASVRSWLFAIAWRKAKDGHRRRFRQRQREEQYHHSSSSEANEIAADERLAIQQALEALPLEQRAAVVLCLADGFTHAEAADALGMPLGTVKSYVLRGRERIRVALEPEK